MRSKLFACILLTIAMANFFVPVQARIKCWTNHEGVKECGNQIPPEFSQKKSQELSEQGLVVGEKERAKTPEELVEAEQIAKIQAKEQRKKDELARQQEILLDSFASAKDIQNTADREVSSIESDINLIEKRNVKLRKDLDKDIKIAANAERAGEQPDESLVKDIEFLRKQVQANQEFIAKRKQEKEEVKQQYADKMRLFNDLTKK